MSSQRICLFGGTFDPIHIAHLEMAQHALETFALDRVIFIPAANPPHKHAVTPYDDRLQMVKLACANTPQFQVSEIEKGVERSYTITTLERFRGELGPHDSLFFLIGADAFSELQTWHRWRDVIGLTQFIVVSRPGATYDVPAGAVVHGLEDLCLPAASTSIRAKLAAGEATPEVPAVVREYIADHGLYRLTPAI